MEQVYMRLFVIASMVICMIVGYWVGRERQRNKFYKASEGSLIIVEEPGEPPYMFLELVHGADRVMNSEFVELQVVKKKYINKTTQD